MKGGRGEGTVAVESRSANIRGDYVADSDFVWWERKSCFSYESFVIFWVILVFNIVRVVCVTR